MRSPASPPTTRQIADVVRRPTRRPLARRRCTSRSTQAQPLRYGENPHQQGARYRVDRRAQLVGRRRAARRQGAQLPQPVRHRGGVAAGAPLRRPGVRDRQARQPVRRRRRRRHHRRPTSRPTPAIRSARSAASSPLNRAGARGAGRGPGRRCSPRWSSPRRSTTTRSAVLAEKKNLRVLTGPRAVRSGARHPLDRRRPAGASSSTRSTSTASTWRVVTAAAPTDEQWADLRFAWQVCAAVSSNAIVYAKDGQAFGIGAGQQNRLDSARIAAERAAGRAAGGVCASDAFFPFRDGLDAAAAAGIRAVIQPGGSVRDDEVDRRRRRARHRHGLHRRAPLPPLTPKRQEIGQVSGKLVGTWPGSPISSPHAGPSRSSSSRRRTTPAG